jgi:hypothetical protein
VANTTLKMKEELVLQPTNSLNKVHIMTGFNPQNISAMGCHLLGVFQIKMHSPAR